MPAVCIRGLSSCWVPRYSRYLMRFWVTLSLFSLGCGSGGARLSVVGECGTSSVWVDGVMCGARCDLRPGAALEPAPGRGCRFVEWSSSCGSSPSCRFEGGELSVRFERFAWPLDVTVVGLPAGASIRLISPSQDCSAGCQTEIPIGTTMMLEALVPSGWGVTWSGACLGNASRCAIDGDRAQNVTVTFAPQVVELVVDISGPGSVLSSVGACPSGRCVISVAGGQRVELEAVPGEHGLFDSWTDPACSQAKCQLELSTTKVIGVRFNEARNLRVGFSGAGGGAVRLSPDGPECTAACTLRLDAGVTFDLVATENARSRFLGFDGGCRGTACSGVLATDLDVDVAFDQVVRFVAPQEERLEIADLVSEPDAGVAMLFGFAGPTSIGGVPIGADSGAWFGQIGVAGVTTADSLRWVLASSRLDGGSLSVHQVVNGGDAGLYFAGHVTGTIVLGGIPATARADAGALFIAHISNTQQVDQLVTLDTEDSSANPVTLDVAHGNGLLTSVATRRDLRIGSNVIAVPGDPSVVWLHFDPALDLVSQRVVRGFLVNGPREHAFVLADGGYSYAGGASFLADTCTPADAGSAFRTTYTFSMNDRLQCTSAKVLATSAADFGHELYAGTRLNDDTRVFAGTIKAPTIIGGVQITPARSAASSGVVVAIDSEDQVRWSLRLDAVARVPASEVNPFMSISFDPRSEVIGLAMSVTHAGGATIDGESVFECPYSSAGIGTSQLGFLSMTTSGRVRWARCWGSQTGTSGPRRLVPDVRGGFLLVGSTQPQVPIAGEWLWGQSTSAVPFRSFWMWLTP